MESTETNHMKHKVVDVIQNLLNESSLSHQITVAVSPSNNHQERADSTGVESNISRLLECLQDALTNLKKSSDESKENIKEEVKQERAVIRRLSNPDLVQISAENSEINRRIQAFMERKRGEVDRTNQREFCSAVCTNDDESSCARTDAVLIPRGGTKSHVKVSRVAWEYGPQTRPHLISAENMSTLSSSRRSPVKQRNQGVEDRLHNMESFLKLSHGQKHGDTSAIFQRIKVLEERILHLESVSPEYLTIASSPFKRQRIDRGLQDDTDLQEIDDQIKKLQDALMKKKEAFCSSESSLMRCDPGKAVTAE